MVLPALTVVINPEASIVATAGLLLLHTPPLPVVVMVLVLPTQMVLAPLREPAFGAGLTATLWVSLTLPQAALTV